MLERHSGMPCSRAALAAWTSPRRAYIPAIPTGESTIGNFISWPRISVFNEMFETSTSTLCRRRTFSKSDEFSRSVASE